MLFRNDLRKPFLLGWKDEFREAFNSTIDGQKENLNHVIRETFHPTNDCKAKRGNLRGIVDIIWERLESVACFRNFTMND